MTRETDFYRKLYKNKFRSDDAKAFQIFGVPISYAKIKTIAQFHPASPLIKYHQKIYNSSCLSSLESQFHCINYSSSVPALINSTKE